jgi:hypothetical protein
MRDDQPTALAVNPFEAQRRTQSLAESSARALQERENTEVAAQVSMAKRYPRDVVASVDRIRNAFARPTLAAKAVYAYSRGGTDINGMSIRAAEAIAREWGNMHNGWREVSRSVGDDGVGVSWIEAYSVDFESNNREAIRFFVRHWRDTKQGGYKLLDERDVYELCANQAKRRERACIGAMIPSDVIELALDQAAATLKARADTSPEGIRRLLEAFAKFGVTREHIEKRIQRRLETIHPAQWVHLQTIWQSIDDEMSTPAEWFEVAATSSSSTPATRLDELIEKSRKTRRSSKSATPPADATAPSPAVDPVPVQPPLPVAKLHDFVAAVELATSRDDADVVLDRGRPPALSDDDYAKLVEAHRARWGE